MASVYNQRFNTPPPPRPVANFGTPPAPGTTPGQVTAYRQTQNQPDAGGGGGNPQTTKPPASAPPFMSPQQRPSVGDQGSGDDSGSLGLSFSDAPDFAATDPAKAQSDFTWGVLQGIISGKDLPFGPGEIDSEKTQAKTNSENTFNQAKQEIQGQQAETGFASSPAAARPLVEARIGASQQYGKSANDIVQNAAQQNFNARLSALQGAQAWIESLRSYVASMTGTWFQREEAKASLKLAEANFFEQQRQFNLTFAANNAG